MARAFDGIILDIDGTIWNTTGIVATAWNKAIDFGGFVNDAQKVNAQILQKEFGKTMETIANNLWGHLSPEDRKILMAHCCTEEHIAIRENTIDISYPGVVETIIELSQQHNFYVVSNCQAGYIELMLEKLGLEKYILDFESYGRTGKGKAENIQLLKTRRMLKDPVYVGDTQGDADACHQCGIPFIWASYGFGTADRYYDKLERFSDLKRILN